MHVSIWNHKRACFLGVSKNQSNLLQNLIWVLLNLKLWLNIRQSLVGLLGSVVLEQDSKVLGGHLTVVLMIIDQLVDDVKNLVED